ADWVLIGRGEGTVRWWQPFAWLAYPAAYAALALMVLNHAGRRAPYYFLDPGSVGAGTVVVNTSILALGLLGLGYLLALARRTSANA
ncbi:MAG TPA: Pr6Pr family membrane protein, partial [Mycobacterium sp.]